MQLRNRVAARSQPARLAALPAPDTAAEPGAQPDDRRYAMMVAGAIAIGFVVRAMFVFSSSFPLNDGGMFYAMVRDVQANGYTIPQFTSYNAGNVPFTYPPLGFYLAAIINDATPLGLVQVLRLLPLALSMLTIVAFFLLARDMIRSRLVVATAVLFFAVLPPAFTWMIMGGGLTRALGFVFAILTIREVRRMYVEGSPWRVASASLLASLTVLSHLEMAWFACIIAGLCYLSYGRSQRAAMHSAAVGAATLALTAPWWALMIAEHGLGPMVAAAHSTQSSWWHPIALLVQFNATGEPLFALLGMFAVLGIVATLARREYVLSAWVLAVAFLDQRAFLTSSAVALALLAAIGAHEVLLPIVTRPRLASDAGESAAGVRRLTRAPRWLGVAVMIVAAAYPVLGAIASTPGLLQGLTPGERAAMAWVSANTDPSARFVVVSGRAWPADRNAEWFPVLAHRENITTVQGYEWLPKDAFDVQRAAYADLQSCANSNGDCIASWTANTGKRFDFIYVATLPPADAPIDATSKATCCDGLRTSLRNDPRYRLVFDGPGATIFALVHQ